jgi:hypothetical protein
MAARSTEWSARSDKDVNAGDNRSLAGERRRFPRRLVGALVLATPLSTDQMAVGAPLEMLMTDASQEGVALVARVSVEAAFLQLDFKPSGSAAQLTVHILRTGRKGPNYLVAGRFVHDAAGTR